MKYSDKQKKTIDYIYKSLKASGYDDVSIAGILGNALTESSLNPDSISSSKTYHGLFQNDKNIRLAVVDKYGDYSLKSQLKYAHDWATGADWVKGNKHTLTNAGLFKRTGYKNAHEASDAWSHLYERAILKDKNGNVVGYQKDPERRANAVAMYDYINNTYNGGIKVIKNDAGKKMIIPLTEYGEQPQYESTWKPEPPIKTIYPLNNTTPKSISSWSGADAPNATPRLKDFLEVRQEDLNRGVNVYGDPVSPFSLRLSLPKLSDLLQLNTPLRLAQEYFADALGLSDIQPEMPSLFPRLKNGKLPRYKDGKTVIGSNVQMNNDNTFTDDYTRVFDNLRIYGKYPYQYRSAYAFNPSNITRNIRNIMYSNIDPVGYDLLKSSKQLFSGEREYSPDAFKEALWAKYLGKDRFMNWTREDNVDNYIIPAIYAPTVGKSTYSTYRLNPDKFNSSIDRDLGPLSDNNIVRYFKSRLEQGKNNIISQIGYANDGMGYYTMGSGKDENGRRYVSYYDDWDINPFYGNTAKEWTKILPESLKNKADILHSILGTSPFTLYDRRYLSDEEWNKLGGYKDGKSPIHIKPANRGKLTRLKKRTGKSESELYNDGNPAHKKMVVFARNARKWKH